MSQRPGKKHSGTGQEKITARRDSTALWAEETTTGERQGKVLRTFVIRAFQTWHHLQDVQWYCRVTPPAGGETVSQGDDFPHIGHAHRKYLAHQVAEPVSPMETQVGIGADGAGAPGQEGGGRQVNLRGNDVISTAELSLSLTGSKSSARFSTCPSMLCVQAASALYKHRATARPYW